LSYGGLKRVSVELGVDPAESEMISGYYERFSVIDQGVDFGL
jgi:hypothetical protein